MARISSRVSSTRRPQALAKRLAASACRLRALTLASLETGTSVHLAGLYRQARCEISSELAHDDFADLLAQVLVYSCLLVRRSNQKRHEPFAQTLDVFLALPALPPFVRRLLMTLWQNAASGQDELTVCVRDLVRLLLATDIQALLEKMHPACLQSDPLIYFYEMFLTAYAPRQRSQRGVYYTPAPVITYMVRAIDELLREAFAYAGGLVEALQAEPQGGGVSLYDPACGTGAFLWGVLDHAREVYRASSREADWQYDLLTNILPRLSGCEIMPATYLLACIELAMHQADLDQPEGTRASRSGAQLPPGSSSCISLANALVTVRSPTQLPLIHLPIILGNPPYAGHALDHSNWLGYLLESYKRGDAGLKKRAQTRWLSDDYVQFLRLAQWQVEQAGRGIVAFLTSHSYLDNPTFRAMRLSLLHSFDEIYILDLHGNSKRREQAPGGVRDRNIFTIQQGIAIGIFVKRDHSQDTASNESPEARNLVTGTEQGSGERSADPDGHRGRSGEHLATVHHADVWGPKAVYTADESGTRQLSGGKLGWLANHDLSNTPWQISQPVAPFYVFTPRDSGHQAEYMASWSVAAIFAPNGDPAPGLVTCHDQFAISWTATEAATKIARLLATGDEAEARSLFRLCAQGQWDYATARRALSTDAWRNELGRVHYRPFDTRWTVFERHVAVHLRERVTRHMRAGPNLALAVGRAGQVIDGGSHWDSAFCSRLPTEFNLYRRGGNYLFPLYLYPASRSARVANLDPRFIAEISQRFALRWLADGSGDLLTTFGPDDIFAYIYALLHAPGYRARYADFLKIDFPRIPLPTRIDLFRALCSPGRALSQVHLLEQSLPIDTAWSQSANTRVEHVRYLADECGGRVWINAHQYLDQVSPAVWALTIGGYQVAKKWLWDRRGRLLTAEEMVHYCQIIASLVRTLELMETIDHIIESHGGWPL